MQFRTHVQMPLDVLDRHRRVVDEDADGQGEAAQGHDIERLAERVEHEDRGEDGQRDRDRDDAGAAPIAEEQQDQRGRETGGDQRLADHAADGRAHETGLIEQGGDLDVLRQQLRIGGQLRE